MLQAPLFTAEALLRAHGTVKLSYTQSHTCTHLLVLQKVNTSLWLSGENRFTLDMKSLHTAVNMGGFYYIKN